MNNIRLLTIISALCYVAIGISSILTSLYLQHLGASPAQIAFIQASVVITTLIASYLWGNVSDQLGQRKPMLVGGLFILAVAYLLLSRAPTSNWAWAARVLEGLGGAAYATLSLAMMGDLLEREKQRGRSMGIWRGLGSLSFAAGAILGGWVADTSSDANALLLCVGLYAAATVAALALREVKPQPNLATVPAPATNRPLAVAAPTTEVAPTAKAALPALFLIGVFFWICAHSASASMWPIYMNSFGYSSTASGFLWGMAAVVEMVVMIYAGSLSDRWGRTPLLVIGALGISLTNFGYLTLARYFPALLGIQFMRGIGFGSYTTAAMTYATEHGDQRNRGSKTGIYNTATSAGGLVGTFLGGNLVQLMGFGTLYGTCAALALASAGCFWWLNRRQPQHMTDVSTELATGD